MKRFFQAAICAAGVLGTTAMVVAAVPNVQLRLSGAIVGASHGKVTLSPINRAVKAGEVLRFTIVAHNSGAASAYEFMPVGKVPALTQLLKLDTMPKGTRVSYSADGKHWLSAPKNTAQVTAIRWAIPQPLRAHTSAVFAYEVRVK